MDKVPLKKRWVISNDMEMRELAGAQDTRTGIHVIYSDSADILVGDGYEPLREKLRDIWTGEHSYSEVEFEAPFFAKGMNCKASVARYGGYYKIKVNGNLYVHGDGNPAPAHMQYGKFDGDYEYLISVVPYGADNAGRPAKIELNMLTAEHLQALDDVKSIDDITAFLRKTFDDPVSPVFINLIDSDWGTTLLKKDLIARKLD
jgi:hypothetical protein